MIIDRDAAILGALPGLPDDVFDHDGLVTKQHVRASALCALRPVVGQLLWDIGTGAASVAIEWCRAATDARAVGIERDPVRAARALANAERLTMPGAFSLARGRAADVIDELPTPDAVFIGGGASAQVIEMCWSALEPGGRIVVHGVTHETEALAVQSFRAHGGAIARISVEHGAPLAGLLGWEPLRTVIQWSATKTS